MSASVSHRLSNLSVNCNMRPSQHDKSRGVHSSVPPPDCEGLQGLLLPLLQGPPHRLLPPTAPQALPDGEFCPVPGCPHLLFIRDGLVAAIADPHFKLEAHQRDGGALGAALAADGLPALAAVVL